MNSRRVLRFTNKWLGRLAAGLVLAAPVCAQTNYVVPATRDVRDAANAALTHFAEGRNVDALASLQFLLEDGREGLLIGADFPSSSTGTSAAANWIGAAAWARGQLETMDADLRQLYGERVGRDANLALERAQNNRARGEFLEVARRFPGTIQAARALIARGDLAFENGRLAVANRSWQEAHRASQLAVPSLDSISDAIWVRHSFINARIGPDGKFGGSSPPNPSPFPPRLDSSWSVDLPSAPREGFLNFSNLRPWVADNTVWLNTGLRVMSMDLFSGEQLWDSGEVKGWDQLNGGERLDLVRGVGQDTLISRVAVDEATGILVGALQLPISNLDNDHYDGIQITVSLPERRLFAFDSVTGAPLWDHAPRLGSNISLLGAETFQERMRIAAPPLIQDGLVYVPCYELAGRITLFVAAFDLRSGELAWRTRVVSGQQRVNLFGVHEAEFNSAPLVSSDGKLIVLTQLGVVATLDIETGEPIWEAPYEQYDLPRNNGYYTPERARVWQATPPVVADGTIFTTPVDSPDLVAFDLESGEQLWSKSAYDLRAREFSQVESEVLGLDPSSWGLAAEGYYPSARNAGDVDHLITASRDTVWLGGDHVVAWTNSGEDLSRSEPDRQRFGAFETPGGLVINRQVSPRPLAEAYGDSILAPSDWGVLAIDRSAGTARALGPFGEEGAFYYSAGSLGAMPGVLVHVDEWHLTGWMHWGTLVLNAEQRLADARMGGDPEADRFALDLALLHINFAVSDGQQPALAWGELEKASGLLFGKDDRDTEFSFDSQAAKSAGDLERARFRLLETKAAWQGTFGDTDLALSLLAKAIVRTPDANALCRLLHSQLDYLGSPLGGLDVYRDERLKALGRLIDDCSRLLTPEAYVGTPLDPDTSDFIEAIRLIGGPFARPDLPVGAKALVARSAVHARAGDYKGALADLHQALWDFGLLHLSTDATLGTLLEARIQETIDLAPPGAYASQEAAAQAQLAAAATVEAAEQRSAVVAGVLRRWPHSSAARTARRQLLELAVEQLASGTSSLADLATRVYDVLDNDADKALQWSALFALGWGASETGNGYLAATILDVAIASAPGAASNKDLQEARDLRASLSTTAVLAPIDQRLELRTPLSIGTSSGGVRFGPFEPILTMDAALPGGGTRTILLSGNSQELYAFEATRFDDKGQPTGDAILWKLPIGTRAGSPWSRLLCALPAAAPEVICAITTGGLIGIDPIHGDLLWSVSRPGMRAVELAGDEHASGGMVIAQWLDTEGRLVVEGFDAIGGASLWQEIIPTELLDEYAGAKPLVSGPSVALLSRENDSGGILIDTVRGQFIATLFLQDSADIRDREASWAVNGQLFVPHFFAATDERPNTIDAFDMQTGGLSYQIKLEPGMELAGIAHFDSKSYLWLLPTRAPGAPRSASNMAQLLEFDPGLGATRRISELDFGDRVVGLPLGETIKLDGPMVLVSTRPTLAPGSAQQGPITIKAIGLPEGHLWTLNISAPAISGQGLYDGDLPSFVLARDTIAMTYAITKNGSSLGRTTRLLLLDRKDGRVLEDRALTSTLGRVEGLSLRGIGTDLYLFGRGIGSGRGRLEVLGSKLEQGGDR